MTRNKGKAALAAAVVFCLAAALIAIAVQPPDRHQRAGTPLADTPQADASTAAPQTAGGDSRGRTGDKTVGDTSGGHRSASDGKSADRRAVEPGNEGPGRPEDGFEARYGASDWHGPPDAEFDSYQLPFERADIRGDHSQLADPLNLQHRLMFKHIAIGIWRGMLVIYGSVWSDFPRDPAWGGGTLLGLRVNVSLARNEAPLETDHATDTAKLPRLAAETMTDVAGARVESTALVQDGGLGRADFRLPVFRLPLPPGAYRLRVELNFSAQTEAIQEALKHCPGLYGHETSFVNGQPELADVYNNKTLRDLYHRQIFTLVRSIHDDATLLLGNLIEANALVLRGHGSGQRTNMVIRDRYVDQLDWVRNLQRQRADLVKKDVGLADLVNIDSLIARYGGELRAEESRYIATIDDETSQVLGQIRDFEDRLCLDYWILCQGWLLYPGWHSLNRACFNVFDALQYADVARPESERVKMLNEQKAKPGGLEARWEKRAQDWKYYPHEIRNLAFTYLRSKEETSTFDARLMTVAEGQQLRLDTIAIRSLRGRMLETWLPAVESRLLALETPQYCMQVWPHALKQARQAARQVIRLGFAWEHNLRTKWDNHDAREVRADWVAESTAWQGLQLAEFYADADVAPGTVKVAFDACIAELNKAIRVSDFAYRWRVALDEQRTPPGR